MTEVSSVPYWQEEISFPGYRPSFSFLDKFTHEDSNFLKKMRGEGELPQYFKLKENNRNSDRNILIIMTGGTLTQRRKPSGSGELEPFKKGNLCAIEHMPNLLDVANPDVIDMGAIDSSNLHLYETRGKIADLIFYNRNRYDGFVVTHGTDSMDVTAASLPLMVQELGKPMILTGSQYPVYYGATDAKNNLYNACACATMPMSGAGVFFGNSLLNGIGVVKVREEAMEAFETPNYKTLGSISLEPDEVTKKGPIKIDWKAAKPSNKNVKTTLFTKFSERVEALPLDLGASFRPIIDSLRSDKSEGVVIYGVGAGNISDELVHHIEYAVKQLRKPVAVPTTCLTGSAQMGAYGPGLSAKSAGAVSALNLTKAATTVKLAYAIGVANDELEKGFIEPNERLTRIYQEFHRDVAGEFEGIVMK